MVLGDLTWHWPWTSHNIFRHCTLSLKPLDAFWAMPVNGRHVRVFRPFGSGTASSMSRAQDFRWLYQSIWRADQALPHCALSWTCSTQLLKNQHLFSQGGTADHTSRSSATVSPSGPQLPGGQARTPGTRVVGSVAVRHGKLFAHSSLPKVKMLPFPRRRAMVSGASSTFFIFKYFILYTH